MTGGRESSRRSDNARTSISSVARTGKEPTRNISTFGDRRPLGDAQRLRARLRHGDVLRHHRVRGGRESASAINSSTTRRRRPRRRLWPRCPAASAGQRLQKRGPGLRDREARAAAAWAGRIEQKHDRPAAEKGPRALFANRRRSALHDGLGVAGRSELGPLVPMHEEPLHWLPERFRQEVTQRLSAAEPPGNTVKINGELCPFCRYVYASG